MSFFSPFLMNILEYYLNRLQEDYAHPLQTRPKTSGGITKQKAEEPLGAKGPSGAVVDLDAEEDGEENSKSFHYKYK